MKTRDSVKRMETGLGGLMSDLPSVDAELAMLGD